MADRYPPGANLPQLQNFMMLKNYLHALKNWADSNCLTLMKFLIFFTVSIRPSNRNVRTHSFDIASW